MNRAADHFFPPADHRLSDDEMEEQYGDIMAEALDAFRTDPEYLILMMESYQARVLRRTPKKDRSDEQNAIKKKRQRRGVKK